MTRIGAAFLAGTLLLGGGTAATTSASWSAVLIDAGGTAATGHALTLTWAIGLLPQYVSVRNTGTLALTAQSYTVTGGTAAACVGGSWNVLGSCTAGGTVVALAANAKVTLPVGGSAPIKVTPAGTSVTLTVSTARADARLATTTSS